MCCVSVCVRKSPFVCKCFCLFGCVCIMFVGFFVSECLFLCVCDYVIDCACVTLFVFTYM